MSCDGGSTAPWVAFFKYRVVHRARRGIERLNERSSAHRARSVALQHGRTGNDEGEEDKAPTYNVDHST
jgi:hypothetical protein